MEQQKIKVLHSVGSLGPQSGGTGRVVRDLTDALSTVDNHLRVLLLSQRHKRAAVIHRSHESRVDELIEHSASEIALRMGLPLRRLINKAVSEFRPNVLHDHGVWLHTNHCMAASARQLGIPIVVHTHGMLEPWSLKSHGWKKRMALRLYQRRDLETAALLFATADQEAVSIRKLGLRQPIAVIPNGVAVARAHSQGVRSPKAQDNHRTVLFLSRIHPQKGLLNLIEAWGRLRPAYWRLCIAGPDEDGHLRKVLQQVRMLGIDESVDYVGEVEGDTKRALFEKADLFVLPSFSENFGVVVAEALAHGVPVITTRGTPWEELQRHGCGWWIEPTADALTETFGRVLNMEPADLRAMGEKGVAYVRKYDWQSIAQQTLAVYRWVLGQSPMPACVVLD